MARNVIGILRAIKIVFRAEFEEEQPYEREFKGMKKFEPVSRSHEGLVDILQVGRNDELGYFYYIMELADGMRDPKTEIRTLKESQPLKPQVIPADRQFPNSDSGVASRSGLHPSDSYVPHTLREELRCTGRLPMSECLSIGLTLTSALEHLHKNGLVHRDIKPSNIIFVNGVPKLADIGLVAEMTEAKSFVGTVGYIPPEGPGTPQADVYSLGKVLYQISTGRDRQDFPQLPTDLRESPESAALVEFNEILLKACDSELRRRYRSAEEMRRELEFLQRGKSLRNRRALQRFWSGRGRAASAILSLTAVVAFWGLLWRTSIDKRFHSINPQVNNLVAQGEHILTDGETADRVRTALDFFNQAAALDGGFAPAQIGLFKAWLSLYSGEFAPIAPDALFNLRSSAAKLKEIAPNLAEARIASSFITFLDGHLQQALAEARSATKVSAASKDGEGLVHLLYGWLLMNDFDSDAGLRELLSAERSSPAHPVVQYQIGNAYAIKKDFVNALIRFDLSLKLLREQVIAYECRGKVYEEMGQFEKAILDFEERDKWAGADQVSRKLYYDGLRQAALTGGPQGYWRYRLQKALNVAGQQDSRAIATYLAHLGNKDEAYQRLELACNEGQLDGLWSDYCWDRKDPRFKAVAKKWCDRK